MRCRCFSRRPTCALSPRLTAKHLEQQASGAALASHLAEHGIKATFETVKIDGSSVGKVFEAYVIANAMDLLVMGAYRHSRLNEMMWGGATKTVITRPPCWVHDVALAICPTSIQAADIQAGPARTIEPMSTYRLKNLLSPRSVALVGASPRQGSVGRAILRNIQKANFKGEFGLVNSHYAEIDGVATVE